MAAEGDCALPRSLVDRLATRDRQRGSTAGVEVRHRLGDVAAAGGDLREALVALACGCPFALGPFQRLSELVLCAVHVAEGEAKSAQRIFAQLMAD